MYRLVAARTLRTTTDIPIAIMLPPAEFPEPSEMGFGWGPDRRSAGSTVFVFNQLAVAVRLPPFPLRFNSLISRSI